MVPILPVSSECVLECELFGGSYFTEDNRIRKSVFHLEKMKIIFLKLNWLLSSKRGIKWLLPLPQILVIVAHST